MKDHIQGLKEYESDDDLAEKAERVVQKRKKLFGSGPVKCQNCPRAFDTKWELNRHLRTCRPEGDGRRRVKLNQTYPCLLCNREYNSHEDFKKHHYLRHTISDIKSKYNRTLEQLVG